MSIITTDSFTGSNGSAWGSDWTTSSANGTIDIQSNAGRLTFNDVSGAYAKAMLTGQTAAQDMEILMSYAWSATTSVAYFDVWLRGSGGWRGNYGPRDGIGFELQSQTTTGYLQRSVSGTTTNLLTMTGLNTLTTAKQWLRFRVQGTSVFVKVWLDGNPEPTAWSYTYTESTSFSDGQATIALNRGGSNSGVKTVTVDDLVVTNAGEQPITFVGAGTYTAGTGACTPPIPAGAQADDIMVLLCETPNNAVLNDSTLQANGWTPFTSSPQGVGSGTAAVRLTSYWKRHSGTESNPVVGVTADHAGGSVLVFRGCTTSGSPIDTDAGSTATASTSVSCPTITTATDLCLIVSALAWSTDTATAQASAWANTATTRIAEVLDAGSTAGNGGGISVAVASKALAGSVGATTATLATSSVQGKIQFGLIADGMGASTTPVTTGASTSWDVRAPVAGSRSTTWTVLTVTAASRSTSWSVRTSTQTARSTMWAVRAQVAAARSTTWAVRARIPAARSTLWDVRTRMTSARSTTWAVRTTTAAPRSTGWAVRARAQTARSSSWDVRARASTARSTTWNVRARASTARSTAWNVRATTSAARSTSWAVRAATASTRSTSWSVRGVCSTRRSTSWDVLTLAGTVTTARSTSWSVKARVQAPRSTTWSVRVRISTARSTSWHTRAVTATARSMRWAVLATASTSMSTSWDVLSLASVSASTGWSVYVAVTTSRSTMWSVIGDGPAPTSFHATLRTVATLAAATRAVPNMAGEPRAISAIKGELTHA